MKMPERTDKPLTSSYPHTHTHTQTRVFFFFLSTPGTTAYMYTAGIGEIVNRTTGRKKEQRDFSKLGNLQNNAVDCSVGQALSGFQLPSEDGGQKNEKKAVT